MDEDIKSSWGTTPPVSNQDDKSNLEPMNNNANPVDCESGEDGTSVSVTECSESSLTLDTLPPELVLQICNYLDARMVIRTLSRVCKFFFYLIKDKRTWKLRIRKRWPKKYPAIPVNDNCFNWKEACIQREDNHRQWSQPEVTTDAYTIREGLYSSVDTVHLMQDGQLLASGSRDRYLNLYDLSQLQPDDPRTVKACVVESKRNAHKGWIWSSDSCGDTLCTGSWDTYIKFWDINCALEEKHKVKVNSAVLCVQYGEDMLVAGGYDKRVYWIDPRDPQIVKKHRYHQQPVLCMAVDSNYIITGSEDKTVAVFDKRAEDVVKVVTLDSFPMSMSYGGDQLWLGDKAGSIHLYDATDADFNFVETYDVGHQIKVTGIIHTLGSIITCSMDKTVKVLEPSLNPAVITTLTKLNGEVAEISYKSNSGILAAACSDASINVWMPKHLNQ